MKNSDFLRDNLDHVAFLELNKDTLINGVALRRGFYLPLLYNELAQNLKSQAESFRPEQLTEGILYLFGLDETFRDKEIYRALLRGVEEKAGSLLPFLMSFAAKDTLKTLIMSLGYIALQLQDERVFVLACEMSNTSYRETGDEQFEKLSFEILQKASSREHGYKVDYHLAYLLYNRNDFAGAAELFEKALARPEVPEELRDEMLQMIALAEEKQHFREGVDLLFAGENEQASMIFEGLRDEFPDWYDLLFYSGLVERLSGNYRKALSFFREALEQKKDDANLYNEMAISHLMCEEYRQAKALLEIALKIDPEHPELLTNFGIALSQLGQTEEARATLKRALEFAPDDEIALRTLESLTS